MSIGESLRYAHELDPSILRRIQAREARVDVDNDVVTAMEHDNGTYLMLQSDQPGHAAEAHDVRNFLTDGLANANFDPTNPRQSLADTVNAVKGTLRSGSYVPS